ncbi:TIGR02206 family membrane protein [Paenibacillus sp. BSR1-1]|uniref:YwaF family protein n=1 Tax=Paenibacillus sp. BSR1-1 TaxID=3020845 RepID=UPI0025AFE96A|nr:TIGR02206 family membrane protein [Paenibacillus sp. BSR1-1]MDN3016416.1 TIGR02206 family membrane protein [Paenibacillus sp. BSR1-1]
MFSVTGMQDFTLFSIPHIVTLIIFFITFFAFVYYSKKLKPYQAMIKWTVFALLLFGELSIQLYLILVHEYELSDLPLHICSLSTFLALYLYFKRSQKAFNLLLFIGLLPPILSMISPDIVHQFPHFEFIRYFLRHSAIPFAVMYFILFEGYRVPRKAILSSFLTINLIAVPIFFLNQLLGTNFFFIANPSETETILTYFGSGIMYYINLEIVAFMVCIITYIPMGILQKRENKNLGVQDKMN